ncbi:hypothetical protein [Poseidonibacter ostreae]|uniref:hypothetical protein n=1 Tax=Poseidonibacter ostreae TaxID=2654171 RepID=UPI00186B31DE|nr:hypothetical protein [Poseidonibacter ostreae]
MQNKLDEAIKSIKNGLNSVENKYDSHIREKAIEEVNKNIIYKRVSSYYLWSLYE